MRIISPAFLALGVAYGSYQMTGSQADGCQVA